MGGHPKRFGQVDETNWFMQTALHLSVSGFVTWPNDARLGKILEGMFLFGLDPPETPVKVLSSNEAPPLCCTTAPARAAESSTADRPGPPLQV